MIQCKTGTGKENGRGGQIMGRLYFVRHGESEWNVLKKICGQTDVPLTDKGREQARTSAAKIIERGIKADEIWCSPLQRAKETAEIYSDNYNAFHFY